MISQLTQCIAFDTIVGFDTNTIFNRCVYLRICSSVVWYGTVSDVYEIIPEIVVWTDTKRMKYRVTM